MELNDFRRQWQQQSSGPFESTLSHQKLQAMLANQPATPVSEMLHNARRDQRMILLVVLFNVGNITTLSRRHMQSSALILLDVAVALMILFASWYAYRQRQLLKQLQLGNGTTHKHIQERIRQIRTLIKNKFYGVMAFLVTVILTVSYSKHEVILHNLRTGTVDWGLTIAGLLTALILLVVLFYIGREQQQRHYGQHLDRLERALRELEE